MSGSSKNLEILYGGRRSFGLNSPLTLGPNNYEGYFPPLFSSGSYCSDALFLEDQWMDSLEELAPVDSLGFLPEEVPSIFQDFQDIIHMDCSTEINGRLQSSQYGNGEVADEATKRTGLAALRDYECTSCPVSSTLKTIKSREDKINENLNYLRSIKSSINRPYNHSNLYNKKYGGTHQQTICTNGSMVNESDLDSRAPYFPHSDERLTADTHCWTHQHNNNNENSNKVKCIRYNNNKNKRCMKTVSCSQNSKGSSLAQLLCDIDPSQAHSLESSKDSSDNTYSYSKMKNITKNNYVNPNKVLHVFGEDECQHRPKEEHVDCYDCSSAAMLDLIDTLPTDLRKPNRHPVSIHSSLRSSPERTNHDFHQDFNVSKSLNGPDCCQSISKHNSSSASSPISIQNRSCCGKDSNKNSSSLRLLLDPDDTGGSHSSSALRALLVSDSKNNNKNGSRLRVLPVPNAPTMQQLLMSKEPIRVRGCTSAVVNPSVLHNLLATGRDVLAGYSITPSASKSEEYIISRNSVHRSELNIGNIIEMEDDETSSHNCQVSEFSNRVQNSEESPKNERYGSQVCPDFPMNSKELIGPYSICQLYNKKTVPGNQNCRPTKVKCQSSTNTNSQSRIRALFDTKESFNIEPSCDIFDNSNQRITTKHGCNSSHQHISKQENRKPNIPEEDIDNQDPLLHSGQCARGLNIYRNTDEEANEEEESVVGGMNLYRNIQDDPDFSLPSLYDLTQQTDYELNTPPSSSNILQCSDLFMTLEHAF